jgi:hypothetical protein
LEVICRGRRSSHGPAGKSDYFFFVDFFVVDFLLEDFFEPAFFVAMALTSFLV